MSNDSTLKTIFVALAVCLVCSVFVSVAAVKLKPLQVSNKLLDKQQNILKVAGLYEDGKSIDELFSQFDAKILNLETGEFVDDIDPATYDMRKAAKDPERSIAISAEDDIASIRRKPKNVTVYFVNSGDKAGMMILPVNGYALWSTLYGFIALEADGQTVYGLSFYEHAETPGLGGEIDNPNWKSLWQGKKAYNDQGEPAIQVIKGTVTEKTPDAEFKVDGLAGATLTSRGVSNLLTFWLGEQGYATFLKKQRSRVNY